MKAPGLLATLEGAFIGGGIDVDTPEDDPRMRTVIMANGAVLQFITADATADPDLQDRHHQRVTARIAAVSVARFERWRRWVERVGWAISTGAWGVWLLDRDDLRRLWLAVVTSLVTMAIRWIAPRLIRWVLRLIIRRAFDHFITGWSTLDEPESDVAESPSG